MTNQVIGITVKGIGDFSDIVSNVNNVQKALTKLKLPDKLGDSLNKNITAFYKEYDKYQQKIAGGLKTQGDYNQVEKSLNTMRNLYQAIGADAQKLLKLDMKDLLNLDTGEFKKISDDITNIMKEIGSFKIDMSPFTKATAEIRNVTKNSKISGDGGLLNQIIGSINTGQIAEAKKQLQELQNYANKVAPRTTASGERMPGTLSTEKYQQLTNAIGIMTGAVSQAEAAMDPLIQKQNDLQRELEETKQKAVNGIEKEFKGYNEASNDVEKVTDSLKKMHQEEFSFNREAQNIDRQIQSYFGLSQMIRKVGDIARDAFSTVKELDKAMTETAVVTNFSVSDMWEMLPTYTAQANQLGSTIKDVYDAATLYYQQGLNTNQAMSLANETLKMARIAGLGAAEATDMMTAALRGFNMEVNQMSAQKINDIYSELAAITASDTAEIGSAMERTASIANSANMKFETTSAFLAQMIETTREAPENLGTAMKTIVARFQEMKQDPTKLIDSEGVAMDANKVDKALKTIGVNLMNTKGEFRDLDDVFLDIASRWDTLSQGQQRYIATIAAGSRQQSRFIAMMSNYERTMELVDAANNSAGASQRQFEKTLDSMAAKLNMLKNAWDQFTMGLMNNQILKFGVDALTEGFTIVNKFIDVLGKIPPKPFEGITQSVLTLVTTLSMLNFGKRASRSLVMGGVSWWQKGKLDKEGNPMEGGFFKGVAEGWGGPSQKAGLTKALATVNTNSIGYKKGQEFANGLKKGFKSNNPAKDVEANLQSIKANKPKVVMSAADIEAEYHRVIQAQLGHSPEVAEATKQEVSGYIKQIKKGQMTPEQLYNKAPMLGITQESLNPKVKEVTQLSDAFEQLGGKVSFAGSTLIDFGVGLGGPVGNALVTIGSLLTTVGNGLTLFATESVFATTATEALGTASWFSLAGVKALGAGLKAALAPIAPFLAVAAAVIAVGYGIYRVATADKRALEETEDAAAAASEAYDSAKQEVSELADAISRIQETDSAFDNLVAGTAEFNEQLVTANEQILALIDKYPMLMEGNYVTTDQNGLMHISDAGFEAVKKYQKQIQANASAMSLIQTADLNALENQQKANELRKKVHGSRRGEMTEAEAEEHAKNLRNADLLEQRADAEVQLARSNAIRTALNGKEIHDVDNLVSVYTNLYDIKRKVAETDVNKMSKHDIRQQYADYHGYTYDKSTKKITDIEGNEVDYDDKVIKDEVIEQTVLLDFEANASSLEVVLNDVDARFANTLENTSKNSKHFISDILANNINTDEDILEKALSGQDFQNIVNSMTEKEMAAVLGISAEAINEQNIDDKRDEIVSLLTNNAIKIAEAQSESYANLGTMLAQTKGWDTIIANSEGGQKQIQKEIKNLTSEQAHMMSDIGEQLKTNAGMESMQTYIGFMSDLYKEIENTQFGNINLDNREIQKNLDGTISTVLGAWDTFGDKEIPIAFSPMLQTGTGTPIELDDQTVNDYINAIVKKANGDKAKILELDKTGLEEFEVEGVRIKGLIADIGDTAEDTSQRMHQIEVDKEAAKEIESIFEGADLTSATSRLEVYNKLLNSSIDTVRDFGQQLSQSSDEANLLGDTFDEFLGGEWQELQESADDFKNALGEFDTSGILKASEQSHTLQTLLDSGKVSASGLAMALQGIEDGKYSVGAVNSSVLELLSSLNKLEDTAIKAHNIIENFDAGIDYSEGEDFVKDNAEKAKELYDSGKWGNPQLQNYIKLAAGEERWREAIQKRHGDYQAAEQDLIKYVTTFKDGFQPAWDQMISGKGINGKSLTENINSSDIEEGLKEKFRQVRTFWDDEGYMQIDFGELTTEELELYFQEAYGVSKEYAQLLMQDLANYDATVSSMLAKNDIIATANTPEFQQTHQDVNGKTILTDEELNIIKEAGGEEAMEALATALGTNTAALEQNSFKLTDEEGNRRDDYSALLRDYAETYKTGSRNLKDLYNDETLLTNGKFDLSKLITDTQSKGFDQEQAMQAAWYAYQRASDLGEETSYQGIDLEQGIATYEEFTASIESALESSKWEAIGESIAQGLIQGVKAYFGLGGEESNLPKDTSNTSSKESEWADTSQDANVQGQEFGWNLIKDLPANIIEGFKTFTGSDLVQNATEAGSEAGLQKFLNMSGLGFLRHIPDILNPNSDQNGLTPTTKTDSTLDGIETSLTGAAEQLTIGTESLSTAGESLNTAATSLSAAAVLLSQGNNGNQPQFPQKQGPAAPGTTVNNANASIVIDAATAQQTLTELNTLVDTVKTNINEGATFNVDVKDSGLSKAAKQASKITKAAGDQNINVTATTSGDAGEIDKLSEAVKKFKGLGGNKTIKLKTSLTGASTTSIENQIAAINSFHLKTDHTVTLKTIKETINKGDATGAHNHGYASAPPLVGSAARGSYGQLGPKGKGGLTLTGELGYEIAWLPSENRSIILGANGPQMINLPGDAVVWTHEQSEKIMKQKAIPAGSHSGKTGRKKSSTSSGKGGGGSKKSGNKDQDKKNDNKTNKLIGKIDVWWDNFSRRVDALQRTTDKALKKFEKSLKGSAGTYTNAQKALKEYQDSLNKTIKENQTALDRANETLNKFETGTVNKKITYKKGKKDKKETVNLSKYITIDPTTGAYQLDENELKKVGNKNKRQAIIDAANKEIDDLVNKANKAEDEIAKAHEELEKVADTMYNTFFSWEKSINKIYILSKKLELVSGLKDFSSSLIDLENAILEAGFHTVEQGQQAIFSALTDKRLRLQSQLDLSKLTLQAKQEDYRNSINLQTYYDTYQKASDSAEAKEDYDAAKKALEIFDTVGGDMTKAFAMVQKFNAEENNQDFYKKVQDKLDNIAEKQLDAVKAAEDGIKTATEIFTTIDEANQFIIDFQDKMLEEMEKQAEEELNKIDKLNDSLNKALKKLLDEVKDALDERRNAEDNQKTETDIAKKQQRLAMLQADTSGGHQVEIAQLQQEIAQSQQDYQRTLEDQLLDRLQKQADKAAEQREIQIELLRAQKELASSSDTSMQKIQELLNKFQYGNEEEKRQAENALRELYRKANGYYDDNISEEKKAAIDSAFTKDLATYGAYMKDLPDLKALAQQHLKDAEEAKEEVKKAEEEKVNLNLQGGSSTSDFAKWGGPTSTTKTSAQLAAEQRAADLANYQAMYNSNKNKKNQNWINNGSDADKYYSFLLARGNQYKTGDSHWGELGKDGLKGQIDKGLRLGFSEMKVLQDLADTKALGWEKVIKAYIALRGKKTAAENLKAYFGSTPSKERKSGWKAAFGKKYDQYKTGGLADYTGPAWLDGTPSKPELVLNSTDTKNFIALKDVLSKAMGSTSAIENTYGGDTTFEINVNVDHLNNDYDVDKVAERVKKIIVKDSSYRNVTQVRNFR